MGLPTQLVEPALQMVTGGITTAQKVLVAWAIVGQQALLARVNLQ